MAWPHSVFGAFGLEVNFFFFSVFTRISRSSFATLIPEEEEDAVELLVVFVVLVVVLVAVGASGGKLFLLTLVPPSTI